MFAKEAKEASLDRLGSVPVLPGPIPRYGHMA